MGITTLNDKDVNLALALGGLDQGISPLEFAGAYSSIANDGVYIEPTFYTKIDSHSNETILVSKQKKRRVISKDSAFILKQLLTEPVTGSAGTATYCSISGMDVAAKTGTTNENYDRWLCGFTPYYTAVCWYGFDMNESINFNGKNPAGLIWSSVMKNIHSGLPSKKFEKTDGVVTSTICRDSGKVANSSCPNTFTEYFLKGTVPDMCTQHSGSSMNSNKTNKNNSNSKNTTTNISTPSSKEKNNSSSSTQSTVKTEQNNTPTETNNKTTTNTNTTPSSSSTENKTPSNNSSSANTNTEKNNTVNNVNNSTSQNNSTSNENTTQ